MPPNIEFTTFLVFFTTKGARIVILARVRCAINFFSVLQGAMNQKRLKTLHKGVRQFLFLCLGVREHKKGGNR